MSHRVGSALVLALALARAAAALDITACSTTVASGQTGTLLVDLDCSGSQGVQLDEGAVLAMNGRAIAGGTWNVYCIGDCSVVGPGELRGASAYAVYGYRGRATISDVVLTDNALGIDLPLHRVTLRNVEASSNRGTAIRVHRLIAEGVVANDNGGPGILTTKAAKGSDVTIHHNADSGMQAGSVRMTRLSVVDNVSAGLFSRGRVRLTDSLLTGNVFIGRPADVVSHRMPHLVGTTCGTSVSMGPPPTYALGPAWGVCTND